MIILAVALYLRYRSAGDLALTIVLAVIVYARIYVLCAMWAETGGFIRKMEGLASNLEMATDNDTEMVRNATAMAFPFIPRV